MLGFDMGSMKPHPPPLSPWHFLGERKRERKRDRLSKKKRNDQLGGRSAMDASNLLWEQWQEQVKQFFEGVHGHQKKTLALVVLGMILSGSAVLQRITESISERGR